MAKIAYDFMTRIFSIFLQHKIALLCCILAFLLGFVIGKIFVHFIWVNDVKEAVNYVNNFQKIEKDNTKIEKFEMLKKDINNNLQNKNYKGVVQLLKELERSFFKFESDRNFREFIQKIE